MATTEIAKTDSHGKLPRKDEKKTRKGSKRIPRRARSSHKTWKKATGALQENLLTLLCFDTDSCDEIISQVPVSLFNSDVYRTIADRAIKFFQKYGEAAGDHLPDLLEDYLNSKKRSEVRMYSEALHDLHSISKSINSKYILDELGCFVRDQSLRLLITNAAEEFQQGKTDSAVRLLAKGLDRIDTPQTHGLLGLDDAVHTFGEFHDMEFPQVESALYPVLDFPGMTQINGFRGHFKTGLVDYMAVGLASGVDVFEWSCRRPYKVLLVDGELPPATIQKRLQGVIGDLGVKQKRARQNLHVISKSENLISAPINLADPAQTDELVDFFSKYEIVVLDSITMLVSGVDLNDAQGWEVINTVCSRCLDNRTSIIRVQHLGKDKTKGGRGSIRQEDVLDFCLNVEQKMPDTFHGNATVKVTCTKNRNHAPSDFKPLELELSEGRDGQIKVTHQLVYKNKKEAMLPEIMELMTKNEWKNTNKQNFADKYDAERTTVYRAEQTARERIEQQEEENSLIN